MIKLSLNELKLQNTNTIKTQDRNISGYENKSKKDLVKALSEPKPKIRINKRKLGEIRKDFDELRLKFSKSKINEYRKAFYDIENYKHIYAPDIKSFRHLSESEIKKVRKNLNKLKKSLKSKTFMINMMIIMILSMMNTEKLGVLEHYLKSLIEITTIQSEPMMVLQEEKITTSNIRLKEIDMEIYHLKSILI